MRVWLREPAITEEHRTRAGVSASTGVIVSVAEHGAFVRLDRPEHDETPEEEREEVVVGVEWSHLLLQTDRFEHTGFVTINIVIE
jgi:hypothetical protein